MLDLSRDSSVAERPAHNRKVLDAISSRATITSTIRKSKGA